jgi:uncharacterized protein YneF (UPF0154 family)
LPKRRREKIQKSEGFNNLKKYLDIKIKRKKIKKPPPVNDDTISNVGKNLRFSTSKIKNIMQLYRKSEKQYHKSMAYIKSISKKNNGGWKRRPPVYPPEEESLPWTDKFLQYK